MKAVVNRTLSIKSPIQLCEILLKEGLSSNDLFTNICEIVTEYLKGCQCVSDPYYELMIYEYDNLSKDDEVSDLLSETIKCNIIFESYML